VIHAYARRARESLPAELGRKTPQQLAALAAAARADAASAEHPRERDLLLELARRADHLAATKS
jgi:hypothetical protein